MTDTRGLEEALRQSERRFHELAESMPHIVWTAKPDGSVDYQTDAVLRYTGRTAEEMVGERWLDVIHPDDRGHTVEVWTGALETGQAYEVEFRIRAADGSYRWFLTRAIPVRSDDARVVKWYGTATDIHDQRESARAVERRIWEQAALLDSAQDAILVRDLDHRILYWNAGAERTYGWTAEEVEGASIRDLLYHEPTVFDEATAETVERGEWHGELEHRRKDGGSVVVEGRWSLVRDEDGTPTRVMVINTDISERKRLLSQFLRAQRMESIGTLAGGIAHDLNNVLAPILMALGMLKEDLNDPEHVETLDLMEASARRGADMVQQVLAFARGVEGAQVAVDVARVLDDLGKVVRDTFPKNIALAVHLPDDLWPISGDPTQVHQVLMNLLLNARDAMPDGGALTVSVENVWLDEQYAALSPEALRGPHVRISVTDTGVGIPADVVERIFDPFFTTKGVGHGSGLGLSTVSGIVRSHRGFVNVYSESGLGTTLRVYLPAEPSGVVEPAPAWSPHHPRGAGETVLIVDDEHAVREIARRTLESFGYRVMTAADGAKAVKLFGRQHDDIDLVLTDIMMPNMDGPDTIRALRRMDPDVTIIAASGWGGDGMARVSELGVRRFLSKPYTAETLLRTVRDVLDERA